MMTPTEYEAEIDRLAAALGLEARARVAAAEACADRDAEIAALKAQLQRREDAIHELLHNA